MIYYMNECPVKSAAMLPDKLLDQALEDATFGLLFSHVPTKGVRTTYELSAKHLDWLRASVLHWRWAHRHAYAICDQLQQRLGINPVRVRQVLDSLECPITMKPARFVAPDAILPDLIDHATLPICDQHRIAADRAAGGWRSRITLRRVV